MCRVVGYVSQRDLCRREEELAHRSVRESLNDGGKLLESKGCSGCKGFKGRETRKMMRIWKRADAFDKAFIGKLFNNV